MDVGLALIVCFLMVSMTAVRSQIQKSPANALKKVGDCVTLECVTVNGNCHQVDWQKAEGLQSPKLVYRHGQGMLNNDLYPLQRYSVNERRGCSLTITQLEINDSGRFICMHAVGSGEETKNSILVVIDVAESCMSNVTSNALAKDDGYSLWCAINISAKSVESSNVTLSFHNKAVGERDKTDEDQPLTVKTTLNGTATKENITQRVCRASFPPNTEANYDNTVAFLDVCATEPLIVSYPIEGIAVSPPGPYYKDDTVRCTADGHPPPTFKWTHLKSGDVVDSDTLVINGDVGDKYTCTATNTVKGRVASQNIMTEVSVKPNVQSQIEKGPANALKKVGDSVTLECVTVNKNCDQVEWQKVEGLQSPKLIYRSGIGMVNPEPYPPQRYSVNSTGGCSLTITQLEINDSGRFICLQAVGSGEETRSSILVVIGVTESCLSNVTSNVLAKDDGYSLWCAIKVPAKSVEPSNVTLSFQNKAVGETETTDEKQWLIINTTLTGIAKKENIMRVCRASFSPNTQANYDSTTATLVVCTKQWIVTSVQSGIRKGPANALKKVCDSVTLECVTVNKNCAQVSWQKVEGLQSPKLVYRNGQGMLSNDSFPTTRYSVNSTGGCNLTITQLVTGDSGRFSCVHGVGVGDKEETKTAILVVICVIESCMSNVTSNALAKDDGYSLWCAINLPAKSVEPSDVTLFFQNKTASETTETTNGTQPHTVKTTLTGTAKKENIMQRVCRASFTPITEANYDNTTATLDVCTTQQLIVSYPVENIAVSLPSGDAGNNYTCTVTNTSKGRVASQNITIEVSAKPGYVAAIVICVIVVISGGMLVVFVVFWAVESYPGHDWLHSKIKRDNRNMKLAPREYTDNGRQDAEVAALGPGGIAGIVIGIIIIVGGIVVGGLIFSWNDERSPVYVQLQSNEKKNDPVENIAVSRRCPYYKDGTVRCTADGHPPPTFKWTHLKSGDVVDGDTLVFKGDVGDNYTCTATNTVNRKVASQNITIEFISPPPEGCGPRCVAGAVSGCLIGCVVIGCVSYGVWLHSKKKNDENGEKTGAGQPLTNPASTGPPKPPTASDPPNLQVLIATTRNVGLSMIPIKGSQTQ